MDTLGIQSLNEGLGDNSTTHIATTRPRREKITRLVDVHPDIDALPVCRIQEKIGEIRTCRPPTNYANARAIPQLETGRPVPPFRRELSARRRLCGHVVACVAYFRIGGVRDSYYEFT